MRVSDISFGVVFAVVAAIFMVGAWQLGFESSKDGVPGSGVFPFAISLLVFALSIVLIVNALRKIKPGTPSPFKLDAETRSNLRPFVLTVVGLLCFLGLWYLSPLRLLDMANKESVFYFNDYAFELAAFLFSIYLNRVFGRTWKFTLIMSTILILTVHFCFTRLLYIQFVI